jgi:calcium/proton exchanger cax
VVKASISGALIGNLLLVLGIQIALFICASAGACQLYCWAISPINLVLTPAEKILAAIFSVVIAGQICGDGESNWFEGAQLLAVYAIVAMLFYFLPAD